MNKVLGSKQRESIIRGFGKKIKISVIVNVGIVFNYVLHPILWIFVVIFYEIVIDFKDNDQRLLFMPHSFSNYINFVSFSIFPSGYYISYPTN